MNEKIMANIDSLSNSIERANKAGDKLLDSLSTLMHEVRRLRQENQSLNSENQDLRRRLESALKSGRAS